MAILSEGKFRQIISSSIQLIEAMLLVKRSGRLLLDWSGSIVELWRSDREGEELISDRDGEGELAMSPSESFAHSPSSPAFSSPPNPPLSDSSFMRFRLYLALAFWNQTYSLYANQRVVSKTQAM